MDNSSKTGILMETFVTSGSRLFEDFVSKYGEADDASLEISDIMVTGSARINGNWVDFGIDSSQHNGNMNTSHFIAEGTGAHAANIREEIENYFLLASDKMYSHGRTMLAVGQEIKHDGKTKE